MKKTILLGMILLGTSSAFAGAKDFIGSYRLLKDQVEGETFCYKGLDVVEENGLLNLYRSDITEYGPIISAELNGKSRDVKYSHGEALSTTKGEDTVTLKDDTLTFAFNGRESLIGIPAMRVSDSVAIKLSADKKTAYVLRKTFEGPVIGLGKKGKALCEYQVLK
ncbi:hypothetical protein [Bdellovibrio sp. BCCA]|uniref:hypothetical protein n=1 Tax=unclassified Bdellovibrio TaxID=2633795 RepID=UPI0025F41493|nr:hypothetical protein [uncultured Bdellovibrio sp.]